jgi:hypothetical protein
VTLPTTDRRDRKEADNENVVRAFRELYYHLYSNGRQRRSRTEHLQDPGADPLLLQA